MTETPDTNGAKSTFDLEERTAVFAERVLKFLGQVPRGPINNPLITQLTRSATSVGANYCEANDSVSKKEFRNKIGHCRKESKESKHWLRMIVAANENLADEARLLWQEARELNLIFSKIYRNSQANT